MYLGTGTVHAPVPPALEHRQDRGGSANFLQKQPRAMFAQDSDADPILLTRRHFEGGRGAVRRPPPPPPPRPVTIPVPPPHPRGPPAETQSGPSR